MEMSAQVSALEDLLALRALYREEMNCQIIHDSIHSRPGWTVEYSLRLGGSLLGYGSVAVAGPWKERPTLYEFYVERGYRVRIFDFFLALIETSRVTAIETQSNDRLLTVMLHAFAQNITCESILFEDAGHTAYLPAGAAFRGATAADGLEIRPEQLASHGVVELDGKVAATGGILFHYNRPYGDIYMEVKEPFRRRGLGTYLVQELKRVCYQGGHVPGARCNISNTASRKTLQKAGFVPCGNLVSGTLPNCT